MTADNFSRFFEEVPEDEATRIIMSGLELMRAITDTYGAERGHTLWEGISDLLGKEAKHAIFSAMLVGHVPGRVTITHRRYGENTFNVNKVQAIKAVRRATGLGLKEAKTRVENWYTSSGYDHISVRPAERADIVRDLRDAGFEVN